MKNKDYDTIETFKKSFKDVFGESAEITLDYTFGELAEMQRLIMEQSQQQKESK